MHTFEDTCLSFVHNVCAPQSQFNFFNSEAVIQRTDSRCVLLCHPAKSGIFSTLTVNTAFNFMHFNTDFVIIF